MLFSDLTAGRQKIINHPESFNKMQLRHSIVLLTIKNNIFMKTNKELINEFQIEELETRYEMKGWVRFVACDNPEHCHELPQQ